MFVNNESALIDKAKELFERNRKSGVSEEGFEYFYVCPDTSVYPHQWFWDSCFHIMINAKMGNLDPAAAELETLMHTQAEDGWIGHMNYWEKNPSIVDRSVGMFYPSDETSPLMQPAFIAHALRYLYNAAKIVDNARANELLDKFYPGIKKYYDALYERRVFWDKRPLISMVHPWESGTDNIPAYDEVLGINGRLMAVKWGYQLLKALRVNAKCDWDMDRIRERDHFVVEDVLVNSAYADGLNELADLSEIMGNTSHAKELRNRAQAVTATVLKEMWSEQDSVFYNTSGSEHRKNPVKIVNSFMPLVLKDIPKDIVKSLIQNTFNNPHEFNCNYPVPSVSLSHPTFDPNSSLMLWRGPTWICTNWYLLKGLRRQLGEKPDLKQLIEPVYESLRDKTIDLVKQAGFREYYNPLNGSGGGAKQFGWSALVVDLIGDEP